MPAAAVIPAPIAYIKVVAVKKLVVGFWSVVHGPPKGVRWARRSSFRRLRLLLVEWAFGCGSSTLNKLECSRQAFA